MTDKCYELWRDKDGGSDSFFAADDGNAKPSLPADARLIISIKASSWNEAQQLRYDFMGWGHYRTLEEDEKEMGAT